MITTKELHSYDCPVGRKAGDLDVSFEVDGTHHRATFPFHVDVDEGRFIAVDDDVQYIGETRDELVDHMRTVAASKISLTWTRYIEIEYQVTVAKGPHRLCHSGLGPDAEREGPVTAISLDFKVVEYSSKFETVGRAPSIARRKIRDDGKAYNEEHRWEVPKDAIPFSQECLDALKHIQAAMTAIDDDMRELFVSRAKAVAERLDTITNQQLAPLALVPAEAEASNGKRVRRGDRR